MLSTLLYLTLELLRGGPPPDRGNSLPVSLSASLLKVRSLSLFLLCVPFHLDSSSTDLTGVLPSGLDGDYRIRPAVE